jgi:NAD(P)H-nitrite reductase large subunit
MKYVVIGASAAGMNGAENLRRMDPNGEITVISQDKYIYSRCIIHHYISGERNKDEINFVDKDFFTRCNINWLKGRDVIKLLENDKKVILDDGQEVSYDKLLIASGSKPFIPPIENLRDRENVVGLKTLEDCDKIIALAKQCKSIAVIGAGLIGMDAITGLIHSKSVTAKLSLVETNDRLLPLQLDKRASLTYENEMIEKGTDLYLSSFVQRANLDENNQVISLGLEDGREVPADLVIVATGVRSNIEFLQGTQVEVGKFGLIFNRKGETNIPDIYGAGDVSGVAPIWPVAVKEGITATNNMTGEDCEMNDMFTAKATMNFFNTPILSLGDPTKADNEYIEQGYNVDIEESRKGVYKKIIHKDGIIHAAIIQGDLSYAGILTQLIRGKIDISKVKKSIFKIDYSDFYKIDNKYQFTY